MSGWRRNFEHEGTGDPTEIPAEYLTEDEGDERYSATAHDHPVATDIAHGFMSWQNFGKLLGIASGAQVNPTADEIKAAVQLPANSKNAGDHVSTWPLGVSIILAGVTTTGWPTTAGDVLCLKYASSRCRHIYYQTGTAKCWIRSWNGTEETGSWSPWVFVTSPAPFFLFHNAAAQNMAVPTGTMTKVTLGAESYDVDNRTAPGTGAAQSRFLSFQSGYYRFTGATTIEAASDHYVRAYVRKTDTLGAVTDYLLSEASVTATRRGRASGSRNVYLASGDYAELFVWHDAGGAKALAVGSDWTFFEGQFLG